MSVEPDIGVSPARCLRQLPVVMVVAPPQREAFVADLGAPDDADVRVATTAEEGLAVAREALALVVLSLELPDADGVETYYTFSSELPDHPFLVVSERPRDPTGHELIRAGAMEYIETPALGDGTLGFAAAVSVTRWARRRQLSHLMVDAGVLAARSAGARPLLEEAAQRLEGLASLLQDSGDVAHRDLADTIKESAIALMEGSTSRSSESDFADWLERLVAVASVPAGPTIDLHCQLVSVPDRLLRHLRAATQEMLMNAIRHADADNIRVEVTSWSTEARIRVIDDGAGIAPDAVPGDGLFNLDRRATQLGGGFGHTRRNGQTVVDWWAPFDAPADDA